MQISAGSSVFDLCVPGIATGIERDDGSGLPLHKTEANEISVPVWQAAYPAAHPGASTPL